MLQRGQACCCPDWIMGFYTVTFSQPEAFYSTCMHPYGARFSLTLLTVPAGHVSVSIFSDGLQIKEGQEPFVVFQLLSEATSGSFHVLCLFSGPSE